ncbi:ABC-type glycerol-3-phosphate transport system, substrate-binding protein [Glycomyces sambucus]|uniref:ABC-type glycerol-3-phosphate transport system, substrate-binding protein n=1 Tax=Glycomyces sambucus TaxID=380244 RepID=A0A1G9CW70_9ACTN|nr:extracellular solute-binding protein [Glycomyces sambucus]SDK55902.1 ABC-type glycerol-3-phosphate transport system, substrate-binding protein [Glycomyces sambucus]
MMKLSRRHVLAAGSTGAVAALAGTAACSDPGASGGATDDLDPSADVTISVGDQPTEDKPEELAAFNERVDEFEAANGNITLEPTAEVWEAQTFQAKLAGGTLPTVMGVSLTYSYELIENGQLPDMTPYLEELELLDELNPLALDNVKDDDGNVYTIPTGLFSVGIAYNRNIFEQAGLDPDTPPATWDEVRSFAQQIKAAVPGVTPYAQMTTNNTGGWMLTTMTYSNGGRIQDDAGTESVMGEETIAALQLLHDMRWVDDTMGREFLYDQEGVRQAFAGGTIGMVLQAPDAYNTLVRDYDFDPAHFGIGQLPQGGSGNNGTLTGGTLKLFDAKATPNQLLAAAKWIKFYEFDKFYDEAAALADAESNAAEGNPVGLPGLPPVSQEIYDRYLGWIEPHINVPLEQFASYTSSTLELIAEPPAGTQQTYAALDPVVQQILTDENADIAQAVADASEILNGIIEQAAR